MTCGEACATLVALAMSGGSPRGPGPRVPANETGGRRGTEAIERYFDEYFANWKITLPEAAIASQEPGHLFEHGWHIGFIWGEEHGEEYLEWGTYLARDFIRRPGGSYFCGGYPYGALTYFRCIAHHDDYFEHVDGDGYGEVHNYRLVPLTPRGLQRRGQR